MSSIKFDDVCSAILDLFLDDKRTDGQAWPSVQTIFFCNFLLRTHQNLSYIIFSKFPWQRRYDGQGYCNPLNTVTHTIYGERCQHQMHTITAINKCFANWLVILITRLTRGVMVVRVIYTIQSNNDGLCSDIYFVPITNKEAGWFCLLVWYVPSDTDQLPLGM